VFNLAAVCALSGTDFVASLAQTLSASSKDKSQELRSTTLVASVRATPLLAPALTRAPVLERRLVAPTTVLCPPRLRAAIDQPRDARQRLGLLRLEQRLGLLEIEFGHHALLQTVAAPARARNRGWRGHVTGTRCKRCAENECEFERKEKAKAARRGLSCLHVDAHRRLILTAPAAAAALTHAHVDQNRLLALPSIFTAALVRPALPHRCGRVGRRTLGRRAHGLSSRCSARGLPAHGADRAASSHTPDLGARVGNSYRSRPIRVDSHW
jgi:hypothetical protein